MHLKKEIEVTDELISFLKKEFLDLGYEKDYYGYNGLDLAFWEIRTGRFQTEVFNESDVAFDSLNPVNMRALFSIALSFPLEVRKTNYIAEELINLNIPILNFFGKNQMLNMYEQTKKNKSDLLNALHTNELFSIYNKYDEKVIEIDKNSDYIYIPESCIDMGNYASYKITYQEVKGFSNLEIINSYAAKKGSGYLMYNIYVNNRLVLSEDISKWKYKNSISIFNLYKGDVIEIRVYAQRTAKSQSWQKASVTRILNYSETISDNYTEDRVLCTSPYSIMKNN